MDKVHTGGSKMGKKCGYVFAVQCFVALRLNNIQ